MKSLEYRKLLVVVIIILFIYAFGYMNTADNKAVVNIRKTSSDRLSTKEKLDDFEYMYKVLKENYPFFEVNKRMNNVDWIDRKGEYIKKIKATKNDMEFYTVLNNIVSELNNKHTSILNQSEYLNHKELSSGADGAYGVNGPWYTELNKEKTQIRYLNKWKDTKKSSESSINNSKNSNANKNVRTEILINNKAAYLSIESFDTRNIDEDMKVIQPFLSEIKNYKALIIDIRGNGGGDYSYWRDYLMPLIISKPLTNRFYYVYRGGEFSTKFIKAVLGNYYNQLQPIESIDETGYKNLPPEVKKDFKYYINSDWTINPNNSINFKGKIYLLVDRYVYSSSETFATFAKHTGFATLVGEKTGGDGIGQTPLLCSLPNSGYILNFSYVMGLTSDGICDDESKTEPDIKVDDTSVNIELNNDKTVQTVLKLLNNNR